MRLVIDNVLDEIGEWQNKYGDFMYTVTAFFTNREMVSANKRDRDAALELQGLLKETEGEEQEFILEQKGVSKAGNPKWKLLAFGPVDGPYTYSTLKDGKAPGGGTVSSVAEAPQGTAPHLGSTPSRSTEQDIRKAVALKAAADPTLSIDAILARAERFYQWLGATSGVVEARPSSPEPPAPDPSSGGGGTEGEAVDSPPSGTKWQERIKDWPTE